MTEPYRNSTNSVPAGSVTVTVPKGSVLRQVSLIASLATACTLKINDEDAITIPANTPYGLTKEELANLCDGQDAVIIIGAVCDSYVVAWAEQ